MDDRTEATGYALWLVPAGRTHRILTRRILALSRKYSTPRFAPHVTLLSGITTSEHEALSHAAALARQLRPFQIRLTEIGFLDDYFRCLFLRVAPTHAVVSAHRTAKAVFGLQNQPLFMPHLSLLYGNLPIEVKKRVVFRPSSPLSFEVSGLHLYSVQGPPESWRAAGTFTFD